VFGSHTIYPYPNKIAYWNVEVLSFGVHPMEQNVTGNGTPGVVPISPNAFHLMHTRFRHNGVHRGNKLNSARSRGAPQGTSRSLQDGGGGGRANDTRRTETIRQRLNAVQSYKGGSYWRCKAARMLQLHELRIKGGRIVSAQRPLCNSTSKAIERLLVHDDLLYVEYHVVHNVFMMYEETCCS